MVATLIGETASQFKKRDFLVIRDFQLMHNFVLSVFIID